MPNVKYIPTFRMNVYP